MRRRVLYELAMAAIALLSVVLAFAAHAPSFWLGRDAVLAVDAVLVAVQLGDWLLGLRRADDRRRYLIVTAWELPGLVPLAVSGAAPLRVLRLVRLVRVARALGRTHAAIVDEVGHSPSLQAHFLSWGAAGATFLSALLVWIVESPENEGMARFSDALWWAVVTVTQVGYGDVVPQTSLGKAVAAMLMVGGIALFVVLLSVISLALVRRRPHGTSSVAGELQRLAHLHQEGSLSDEEFKRAKDKVLGR